VSLPLHAPPKVRTPSTPSDLLAAARSYHERGWALTPVLGKKPCLRGWSRLRLDLPELRRALLPGRGLGVLLGAASGGLVDLDLDHEAALDAAPALLPETGLVHGRPGRPWSHYWYRCPSARSVPFRVPAGMLLELRSDGAQTCIPPSPHPSGETLRWESLGAPAAVDPAALRSAAARLALAAYLRTRGAPLAAAVHFARAPDERELRRLERDPDCPPLRAWLGLAPKPPDAIAGAPPSRPRDASPYTRAILARLDVVGAAALLGIALQDRRQQRCPFHDDAHASFQVSGALWRCHAGCGAGTAIHLVARALGLDYRQARNWLAARLGIDWRDC
jgi:hypothetical protein